MTRRDTWIDLIRLCDLEPQDVTPVVIDNKTYAVYDAVDGIFVSDARCTHAGANLCDGYFNGRYIECPLHQGLFDATTGKACAAPVVRPLKMFESRIRGDQIQIKVDG